MDAREAAKFVVDCAIQNAMDEWGSLMEALDTYFGEEFLELSDIEQEDLATEVIDNLESMRQAIAHVR